MSATPDVVELLRSALGVRVDGGGARSTREPTSRGTRHPVVPLAVVHAASVQDVSGRCASPPRPAPLVTRGTGTGLAGAANAGAGEIALSLRGMDRILEVRPDDLLAVVEPGIINADLNSALAEHGLWWAPDPASRAIS